MSEDMLEESPIIAPPPQFVTKRRSNLFCERRNANLSLPDRFTEPEFKVYQKYKNKLETEQNEWDRLFRNTLNEIRRKEASAEQLDLDLLTEQQLSFVRSKPDMNKFVATVMDHARELEIFINRKNELIRKHGCAIDKLNYILDDRISEMTLEHIFLS